MSVRSARSLSRRQHLQLESLEDRVTPTVVNFTSLEQAVFFDFDDFEGSGFSPTPTAGQLNSNQFIVTGMSDGTMTYGDTKTSGDFARGKSNGGVTTGGVYAFDRDPEAGNVNRILGFQPTGSDFTPGTLEIQFKNETGEEITEVKVSYLVAVYNDQPRSNSFNLEVATGTQNTPGTFTPVPGGEFTTPLPGDFPVEWKTTSFDNLVISDLSIPNGGYFFLRYFSDDVAGSDSRDEFGLDNLSVIPFGSSDTDPPVIVSLSPPDDAAFVPVNQALTITFDEPVQASTGNIIIRNLDTDTPIETIAIGSGQITFDGPTVTIAPTANLPGETNIAILIDNGAIEDLVGNAFAGITDETTWNFLTADSAATPAFRITEIYIGISGEPGTEAWFEITNLGNAAGDTGTLFYDNKSEDPTQAPGPLTSFYLTPGESAVFLITDSSGAATAISDFESVWGTGINVGVTQNTSVLDLEEDAVFLFDNNIAGANTVDSVVYGVEFKNTLRTIDITPDGTVRDSVIGINGAFESEPFVNNDPDVGQPLGGEVTLIGGPGTYGIIDLSVMIEVNNDIPFDGNVVTYTVSVTNDAASFVTASGVSLLNLIPNTFGMPTNITVSQGSTSAPSGGDPNDLLWQGISLAPGASATLSYDINVGTTEGTFINFVEVFTADQTDANSTPGNGNGVTPIENDEAAVSVTVAVDNEPPTVESIVPSVVTISDSNVGTGTFTLTVTFSEAMNETILPVISFPTMGEDPTGTITFSAGSFTSPTVYVATYDVADINEELANIDVAIMGGQDLAGNVQDPNPTTVADVFSIDTLNPSVTINQGVDQADPTNASPIVFDVVFSETVTDFAGSDIDFTGSTVGGTLIANVTGTGSTYTVEVTGMTGSGQVVVSITAGAAFDLAGNPSLASTSTDPVVTFDDEAPDAPANLALDPASDSGESDSDQITNITTPLITGTAEPGSTVILFSDIDGEVGTTTADATTGEWAITTDTLSEGTHTLTATTTDAAGNTSPASDPLTITIDVTAPDMPIVTAIEEDTGISSTDGITNATMLMFFGTAEPNSTVEVFIDAASIGTTTADVDGEWSFDHTGEALDEGTYTITATATDAAGNTSMISAGFTLVVDTTSPDAPENLALDPTSDSGESDSDQITNVNTPLITGTAEPGSTVILFSDLDDEIGTTTADAMTGEWSITTDTLTEGVHALTATATDAAGNTSPASDPLTITIDVTAPDMPIVTAIEEDTGISSTDGITNATMLMFFGTAEPNSTVEVFIDAASIGTTTANPDGEWTFDHTGVMLDEGTYTITATATDAAGNTSVLSAGFTLVVDTTPPDAPMDLALDPGSDSGFSDDDGITNVTTPLITGTAEPGSTVTLFSDIDGEIGTTTADAMTGEWSITTDTLTEGVHALTATATDVAGNTSVASDPLSITIDVTAPDMPIVTAIEEDTGISSTDGITNATMLMFFGTAEPNSTIEVFIDAASIGTTTANGDGEWSFDHTGEALDEGAYIITATATDAAGNTSMISAGFTLVVDLTAPDVPADLALDPASDSGESDSDQITNITTPLITGTAEPGSTVILFSDIDGEVGTTTADAITGEWAITTDTLSEGTHTLTATATDAAGNTSPASDPLTITIDVTAPDMPIVTAIEEDTGISSTDGITNATMLMFFGTAEANSTVEVFIDAISIGTTTANADGTWSFDHTSTPLDEGTYIITATATDAAGNTSMISGGFTLVVDTTAPDAPVDLALDPASDSGLSDSDQITNITTPLITGLAEPGSTIVLSSDVDGEVGTTTADVGGIWSISSPPLTEGIHSFTATSTDMAGNTSLLSEPLNVTIDTTPPVVVSIIDGVAGSQVNRGQSVPYTITFDEAIDASTVSSSDFSNAGTASVTIGIVSQSGPGVFTLQVTPNLAGTLILRINQGADIRDLAGNPLDTSTAILGSTTLTVINQPPQANDDSFVVSPDSGPTTLDVLANDLDPDGDSFTIVGVTQPVNGTVLNNGTSVDFVPNPGFVGTDMFTYTIMNITGQDATATVTVTVGTPNSPPIAVDDVATVAVNSGATTIPVLANDSDPDGDPVVITTVTQPVNGTVVITATGTAVTYTPATDFVGTDTFTYTIIDGNGGSASATVSVTVSDQPLPPPTPPAPVPGNVNQSSTGFFAVSGGVGSQVILFSPTGEQLRTFSPFPNAPGGVRVAQADVTGDGVPDLIVGTGPGVPTQVVVINGATGELIASIQPFEPGFTGGVYVAAGDIDGDGIADIAITPDEGGGPRVRIFSGALGTQIADFFVIEDPNFRGGARVALADLNGDGIADILGAAGFLGGPRIALWDGTQIALGNFDGDTAKFLPDFFAFEPSLRDGVFIAGGDTTGDGFADLILGGGPGGGPRVFILDGASLIQGDLVQVGNFFAGDPTNRGGIRVTAKDINGDANIDVLTVSGTDAVPELSVFDGASIPPNGVPDQLPSPELPFGAEFTNGLFVG